MAQSSVAPTATKTTAIQVPRKDGSNHALVLAQLKEAVEAGQRLRGAVGDSFVRVRELTSTGVVTATGGVIGNPSPGTAGSAGKTGATGPPGSPGQDGIDGDQGPPGPKGATGATGPQGPPGFDGIDGDDGSPGVPGAAGPAGPAGAVGAPGGAVIYSDIDDPDPPLVVPGPPGAQGATGSTGSTGSTGAQGSPGAPATWYGTDTDDPDPPALFGSPVQYTYYAASGNPWAAITNGVYTFGNATDNPAFAFIGSGTLTTAGDIRAIYATPEIRAISNANGTTNAAFINAQNNSVHSVNMAMTDATYAASLTTGGPTGEQGVLYTNGATTLPLVFASANKIYAGQIDSSQNWDMPSTVLTAAVTRACTGLVAYKPSTTTASTATLTADTTLQLTFNETGLYAFEIYLAVFEATSGAGGFQCNMGGTASVSAATFTSDSFITTSPATARAAFTAVTSVTTLATVSTAVGSPSWVRLKGTFNVTATGNLALKWAQASALSADPTSLLIGSYFLAIKIG